MIVIVFLIVIVFSITATIAITITMRSKMIALYIVTTIFLLMELANVLALYFRPDSLNFNSVGVFKAWEQKNILKSTI